MKTSLLTSLFAALLLTSLQSSAAEKHEHREHGAHVHGSAALALAFDGVTGKIEFKSPADSIVGFEHKASSTGDKKKLDDSLKKLESKMPEMVSFDASLQCQFSKEKIEVVYESESHSDVVANFKVTCAKSPAGSTVVFNFQKQFASLKDVDAQIIVDNIQKSVEIKTNGTKLDLK